MRASRFVALVAILLAASSGPRAFAQSPAPQKGGQDLAAAESLFREGKTAMAQKRYDEACSKFSESHRLDPQTGTLLNLAACHELAGKTASAWGEFNEVIALATRAGQTSRIDFAKQHAASVEAKLSRVKLVAADPSASTWNIKVDGKVVGAASLGTAIPMDPGAHRIEVSASGRKSRDVTFDVPKGPSTTEIAVPSPESPVAATPTPSPPSEQPEMTSPPKSGSGTRTAGFVLGGVGIAGLAVGTIFGVSYLGKADDYNKCDGFCGGNEQADRDQKSSAQTTGWIATAGFAAGIVGLGAGTLLILTAKPSTEKTSVRVVPGFGGASLQGRF